MKTDFLLNLFVVFAFFFQAVLAAHFTLRRRRFDLAMRYGPLVYALGIPAAALSLALLLTGYAWSFWLGGFLLLAWALFGYIIEYRLRIEWRAPIRPAIFAPYILLYLAAQMFYWFPLKLIAEPLFWAYGVLYVLTTALNIASHQKPVVNNEGHG